MVSDQNLLRAEVLGRFLSIVDDLDRLRQDYVYTRLRQIADEYYTAVQGGVVKGDRA